MNQILFNKKYNTKKNIFKIQGIISIILCIIVFSTIIANYNQNENLENISNVTLKKFKIVKVYENALQDNKYFATLNIPKINLEYVVFNEFTEELLKIAPCKFYGGNLEDKGNIVIAGHNYNNNRFFSRVDELKSKDIIKLISLDGKEYNFIVYDIFETDEDDMSVLSSNKTYELTLITCNNSNKKRIIVKAYRKESIENY